MEIMTDLTENKSLKIPAQSMTLDNGDVLTTQATAIHNLGIGDEIVPLSAVASSLFSEISSHPSPSSQGLAVSFISPSSKATNKKRLKKIRT